MPHSKPDTKGNEQRSQRPLKRFRETTEARYTVALSEGLAREVVRYAEATDTSMSKAIAALVRLGLEGQQNRKRQFFDKLKANLENDDPNQQDRVISEFRRLILGR